MDSIVRAKRTTSSTMVLSYYYTFYYMLLGNFEYFFCKLQPGLDVLFWLFVCFCFFRKGYHPANLPHSPEIWRIQEISVTCSTQLALPSTVAATPSVLLQFFQHDEFSSCCFISFGDAQFFAILLFFHIFSTFNFDCLHCVP